MRLCLDILLDNAIKYTGENIPIELVEELQRWRRGIAGARSRRRRAEAELPHVFDKAYRGSNAAGVAGSGLGLYMARSVDVHGGT
jgi:signal transduction histidine kinase